MFSVNPFAPCGCPNCFIVDPPATPLPDMSTLTTGWLAWFESWRCPVKAKGALLKFDTTVLPLPEADGAVTGAPVTVSVKSSEFVLRLYDVPL